MLIVKKPASPEEIENVEDRRIVNNGSGCIRRHFAVSKKTLSPVVVVQVQEGCCLIRLCHILHISHLSFLRKKILIKYMDQYASDLL